MKFFNSDNKSDNHILFGSTPILVVHIANISQDH